MPARLFCPTCVGETRNRSFITVPIPARTFFLSQHVSGESMESLVQDCPNTCSTFLLLLQHLLGKIGAAHSRVIQHLLSFFSFVDMCWGESMESLVQDCFNTRGGSLSRSNMYWGNAESLVHDCSNTCSAFVLSLKHVLGKVGAARSRVIQGLLCFFSCFNTYWGNLEPLIQDCPNNCGASLSLSGMCWGNAESLICECFKTCSAFFLGPTCIGEARSRLFRIWGETLETVLHNLHRGGGSSGTTKRPRRGFLNQTKHISLSLG